MFIGISYRYYVNCIYSTPFINQEDYEKCIDIFKSKCDSVISVQHKKDYIFLDKKPVNFNPLKTCKSQDCKI